MAKKAARKKTAARKSAASKSKPTSDSAESYEAIPYIGRPRPLAHPDSMATRAHLFGVQPPPVESARVLEIGCADGANLITIAASLPDSVCVGIDRSPTQIASGKKTVKGAELSNVVLGELDFRDLPDKPDEPYDYIIAHGVYSWVDTESQRQLLEKIGNHLAPNGVAFVSYNVYPGWHLRQMVREFLLYHTAGIEDPVERVRRCRTALPGLVQSVPQQLQGYASLLLEEHQLIDRTSDDYIAHEHLEVDNHPCYFHEFADGLEKSGLQFLCEAELSAMQANRYPLSLSQLAGQAEAGESTPDPVRAEQYLDFANLRMFRQTLICHGKANIDRSLDVSRVRDLSASAFGVYEQNTSTVLDNQPEAFRGDKGATVTTSHPLAKAAMRVLAQNWPARLPFTELVKLSHAMLSSSSSAAIPANELEQASTAVAEMLLASATAEIVDLYSAPERYTTSVSEKPVASPLARYQAKIGAAVFTLRHHTLTLTTLGQHMISLLDGKHDHEQLADAVLDLVKDGRFVLQENSLAVTDAEDQQRLARQQVTALLDDFARSALLIA